MSRLLRAVAAAALLASSACTIARISARGDTPLVLNELPVDARVVHHHTESFWYCFSLDAEFRMHEQIEQVIRGYGADAVTRCVVTVRRDVLDLVINLLTYGIAGATHVDVECDVVKIPGGAARVAEIWARRATPGD